jgi:hypothetical protein
MPSITYWNRLEPRPRAADLAGPLAARVRDPLWFLTRQWQFGEFHGEDAGSPSYVRLVSRETPFTSWRAVGGTPEPIDGSTPLERLVETESFADRLGLQAELGELAERMLERAGQQASIPIIRIAYPIVPRTEAQLAANPDVDEARFLRVVAGRLVDGVALLRDAGASAPNLPPRLTAPPSELPSGSRNGVLAVLDAFRTEAAALYPDIGLVDPPAWNPERLEYSVETLVDTAAGEVVLTADPGAHGDFDWYAFDLAAVTVVTNTTAPAASTAKVQTRSVLPANVRFRGMPNYRWWDFETSVTDFSAIQPDRRDLAKLLIMDFMLIAGNDWFVAPLILPTGTICQIDALVVHDVFGGATVVPRADDGPPGAPIPWSMFSTSAPAGVASFYLLPPTAATAVIQGPAIEEVRFLRDETANMVWGVEHTIEGGLGQPLPGQERAQLSAAQSIGPTTTPSAAPLRYQLETLVAENWIPFLPVAIDAQLRDVALERAAVIHARPDGTLFAVAPRGRVLSPPSLDPYQVREEEITRAGTRVSRGLCRARWVDGSTHVWIARRRTVGTGEGSSGRKFDLADERT